MCKGLCRSKVRALQVAVALGCTLAFWPALAAQDTVPMKTVLPVEVQSPVNNPYMGWGLWAGAYNDFVATRYAQPLSRADSTTAFGDDAPMFNWVLLDWPWANVEPSEGEFEWGDFDAIVDYWSARGKQFLVIVRKPS